MDYFKEQLKAVGKPLPEMKETFSEEFNFLKKLSKENVVLDVGCGNGRPADELAKYCKDLICIDNSGEMVKIAKENLSENKNTEVLLMDALSMDFRDNNFDFVYSTYNTMGSIENKEKFIEELVRVVKPRGKIAVFIWKRDKITTEFMERYYPSIGFHIKKITQEKADLGKCVFERLDISYVQNLFKRHGLKNIENQEIGPLWNVVVGEK